MNNRRADELDTVNQSVSSAADGALLTVTTPSLGVIWSRNLDLIGATAPLTFDRSGVAAISRLSPSFLWRNGTTKEPLLDQRISRSPLVIERLSPEEFAITPPASRMAVEINGRPAKTRTVASTSELGEEIVISLSGAMVLCLFNAPSAMLSSLADDYGLLGISHKIAVTRELIRRVADIDVAVLIRGETGTGKELVAQAIHRVGDRAHKPMIAVNMATLSPSLAAAELFGVRRGAFTGANTDKAGLFEQADGGVMFMDEIGDTPREVQPMLLRTLESGEIRRVGDDATRKVNVRVIAATDRSLELGAAEPSFNQPLLRRLESFSIDLPPLRARRVDLGILIRSFLDTDSGFSKTLFSEIPAQTVARLALHAWPGNVRELRNHVHRMQLGASPHPLSLNLPTVSSKGGAAPPSKKRKSSYRHPSTVSDDELLDALDRSNWVKKDAAAALNVSRTALYAIMSRSKRIRDIDEIPANEFSEVIRMYPDDICRCARELGVGKEALKKRLRQHAPFSGSALNGGG